MKRLFTMPDGEVIHKDWPDFKTPWNHDTEFEARRTATYNTEPSATKQEFKEDADINNIVQRVMQTNEVPAILPEHFMDTTDKPSYYEMQQTLAEVNAQFYSLPARLRTEHLNDPARWADEVVKAAAIADMNKLDELGVEISKPQEARSADPFRKSTPAPDPAPKPPEGPKEGDSPKPPKTEGPK